MSRRRRSSAPDWTRTAGIGALAVAVVAVLGFSGWLVARDPETPASTRTLPTETSSPDSRLAAIFVGDSITEASDGGLNLESGSVPWPHLVTQSDGSPWELAADVAVSGREMREWEASFRFGVLGQHPDVVVILLGTNDAANDVPLAAVRDSLASMIADAKAADVALLVVSPPPNDNYTEKVAAVVDAERAVAEGAGVPFVDLFTGLGDHGHWADPAWTGDGTHPSAEGHQQIADYVLSQVG